MIKFCAEIGSNHNQNIYRTINLITEAKKIGCDSVKFQLFKGNQLYFYKFKQQISKMKKWELPENFLPVIRTYCNNIDIEFGCSVFDLNGINLAAQYCDWLKIGSYENKWKKLIVAVARTNKSWMISTGMDTESFKNLRKTLNLAWEENNIPQTIFHCCSNYPASPINCNLYKIKRLKKWYSNIKIGWSDHTTEKGIIYKAIALGATTIEFHFDMEDSIGYESQISNSNHCWYPSDIADVIENVRVGELAEQDNDTNETEASKWRTDPEDGLRPLKEFRKELLNGL